MCHIVIVWLPPFCHPFMGSLSFRMCQKNLCSWPSATRSTRWRDRWVAREKEGERGGEGVTAEVEVGGNVAMTGGFDRTMHVLQVSTVCWTLFTWSWKSFNWRKTVIFLTFWLKPPPHPTFPFHMLKPKKFCFCTLFPSDGSLDK